jgi:hypothetical protein
LRCERAGVEDEEADEESADDGTSTLQGRDDCARRSVEFTGVDGPLIGVEVVGSEEHWEKS